MNYLVPDRIDEPLYVICPIFNPIRFKSRWKLAHRFAKYVKDSGAILYFVEASFGERSHAMPEQGEADISLTKGPEGSTHIRVQVRTSHELWLKENLINIGISRLPSSWKYVAWVDGDVAFSRPNWVGETIHQLQHYAFVQMFSRAVDLSPSFEPVLEHRGFVDCYLSGVDPAPGHHYYSAGGAKRYNWHPGFAWAARRQAIDDVGQLVDFAILGAADNHMAHALVGRVAESVHPKVHPAYRQRLELWQDRANRRIRHNVGCVSGLLLHYWHGKKKDRRYWDRWQILVKNQFNPYEDIKYDAQNVLQLEDHDDARSIQLRDDLRAYFRQRDEDSIDL